MGDQGLSWGKGKSQREGNGYTEWGGAPKSGMEGRCSGRHADGQSADRDIHERCVCGGHRGFGGFENGPGEETPDGPELTQTTVAHHPNPPEGPVEGHGLESGGLWSELHWRLAGPLHRRPGQPLIFGHLTLELLLTFPTVAQRGGCRFAGWEWGENPGGSGHNDLGCQGP